MKKTLLVVVTTIFAVLLVGCNNAHYNMEERTDLIIGLEAAYAPFNWTEVQSSQYTHPIANQQGSYVDGYDVQMAKEIARLLGKQLVIKAIDWDGLIPALKSGSIDMIIAGMSPTAERKEMIAFSDEYFRSEIVMVVKAEGTFANATSLADFSGAKVVAQRGTLYDDAIPQIPNVVHQTPLGTYGDLAVAVSSGSSDAFVAELPVARSIVNANSNLKIVSFAPGAGFETLDEDITVAVGLRKNDTDLLAAVNNALAQISNETRNLWMEAAVTRSEQ